MKYAKPLLVGTLTALAVAACGMQSKPLAGSPQALADHGPGLHGRISDPRTSHYRCLRAHHVAASEPRATLPEIQVGRPGAGPLIQFLPTPGAAQEAQISGRVQSAEVIGSALLYPNQGSGSLLTTVENCTALGVQG
jgi:hypothetical protein